MSSIGMVRDYLAKNALRNVAPLKFLEKSPQACVGYTMSDGALGGAMVLIDNAASSFDLETYPHAAFSVFIDAQHPRVTGLLVDKLPKETDFVFKLSAREDEAAVRQRFNVVRTTSFLSFTDRSSGPYSESAEVTTTPAPVALSIFADQGHSPSWVNAALANGRGFVVERKVDHKLKAACFAIQIFGDIWEVGGVLTDPESRRQGHARAVVETALARLALLGRRARYQVQETNTASVGLAKSLGLQHYLTITHFVSRSRPG